MSQRRPNATGYGTIQSDDKDVEQIEQFGERSPEDDASWISTWFFFFVRKLIWTGYKRPLEHNDLPAVSHRDDAKNVSKRFEEMWAEERRRTDPSLVRALRRAFGLRFFLAALPKLSQDLLSFVSPLAMGKIIEWLEAPDEPYYLGFIYASVLFLAPFLQTIFVNQYFYMTFNTGMQVRAAVVAAVFRKTLRLSPAAKMVKTQGEIVNMQSNDTQRLMDLCPNFHLLWSSPLQIIIALALLVNTLGTSAFVGAGIMVLLIPIQGVIAAKLGNLRKALLNKTDSRVKIINEVLQGIRVIKYYAWESKFAETIFGIRKQEVEILTNQAIWRAWIGFFLIASPVFVSIATFGVYSATGQLLTPDNIFPALAYFNLLRFPLTFMPMLIISLVECNISVNRLFDFLMLPELDTPPPTRIGKVGVRITRGTFTWDLTKQANPTLHDINLEINEGELVMIVGPVGSGKTSLLSAILGSISKTAGDVEISGSVAYTPQQAWIMNKSVRDNITFNQVYIEDKYRATVHASCLKDDFKMLPGGDQTEIGEKGINLSGGQKQRVALARAVYSDADIYILDDVLSAVDSHVGKHIFEECVMGQLKNKTRIFVTHQNQFLPYADRVIVVKDGLVAHQGSYSDLISQGVDFAALIEKTKKSSAQFSETGTDEEFESDESDSDDKAEVEKEVLLEDKSPAARLKEARKLKRGSTLDVIRKKIDTSKLVEAEERETGVVKGNVYWQYSIASGGGFFIFLVFLSYVFCEITRVSNDLWLSVWSTPEGEGSYYPNPPPFGKDTQQFFLWIYIILGMGYCLVMLLRNVMSAMAGVYASRSLHNRSFENVMHSPVSFFDVTPIGRILNRFTKDLDNIDNLLPQFLGTLFTCISTLVVIVLVTYWFLLALVPIMIVYYFCMQYYRHTSRELQRLDSVSRSPVFSHFSETLSGVDTIRAYNLIEHFIEENEFRINYNQRAYWMVQVTNRWLSLRLELLGTLITFGAAIFAVLGKQTGISPSLAGLSITYALQVTGYLNFCVRMATQAEAQMNAVERLLSYADLENEAEWIKPDRRPPSNWPANPSIVLKNVYMRYRPGLEPVLKNISLEIHPREKIGFVGRTGAGKSSMMLILFRMVEIYEGQIIIDGQDIKQFGLHDLRSRLAIIPQDPVLFSGTVRFNLDPFREYTDEEIWNALEKVHLKAPVMQQQKGLDSVVAENGANWSIGQRQLFCFARAILKKTKVLVMDEATSSVDMETDALIQRTIRTEFSDRTVLTIAHRLATVMDSDRVVVMSEGRIVELASPRELIHRRNGVFSSMIDDTGAKSSRFLRLIAEGAIDIFGNVKDEKRLAEVRKNVDKSSTGSVVASPVAIADPFDDQNAVLPQDDE